MKDVVFQKLNEHKIDSAIVDDVMEALSDSFQDPVYEVLIPIPKGTVL
jgi:hypothetical protein